MVLDLYGNTENRTFFMNDPIEIEMNTEQGRSSLH